MLRTSSVSGCSVCTVAGVAAFQNTPTDTELPSRQLPTTWPLLVMAAALQLRPGDRRADRKSTRLNSSHLVISYAVFCLKKNKNTVLHAHEPQRRASSRSIPRSNLIVDLSSSPPQIARQQ